MDRSFFQLSIGVFIIDSPNLNFLPVRFRAAIINITQADTIRKRTVINQGNAYGYGDAGHMDAVPKSIIANGGNAIGYCNTC